MKLFNKDINKDILYIAEIGVNHEGNFQYCLRLINKAKLAGADVVKFQCFTPNKYYSIEENKYEQAKKYYFNKTKFEKIIEYCNKIKINYLFTALTEDWVDFISKHSNTIKIASGDLNFNFLIKKILNKKLKILLSTGISDNNEIAKAYKLIKKKYKNKTKNNLVLLHCVSNYPTKDENINLNNINFLKEKYNLSIGYSNHAIGINACLASICLNAKVIEFHFTDNKRRKFRDHQLSLDEKDVKKLIAMGNNFNLMLGKPDRKKLPINLISLKKSFNKGVIALNNIKKNQKIKLHDIGFARTAEYMAANLYKEILNKNITRDIKAGCYLKKKYFK